MADAIELRKNPLSTASDIIGNLAPVFLGGGTTNSTASKNSLSDQIYAALAANINNPAYSKDAAIKDSATAVTTTMDRAMQQYLPQIANDQLGSGSYSNTTTDMLATQGAAQAAGQAALVQQSAITNYGQINNQANSSIGQVLADARNTTNTQTTTAPSINNLGGSGIAGMLPLLAGAAVAAPMAIKGGQSVLDMIFGSGGEFNGSGPLTSFGTQSGASNISNWFSDLFSW